MDQIRHFEAKLKSRRDQVVATISRLEHELAEPKNPDFEEASVEREGDEVLEQQIEVVYDELHAIDAALNRIRNGSYGICANCHDPISEERLEAVPYAFFCRGCMQD